MNQYTYYSDQELFSQIEIGDEQAFTEFYLRYAKKLYPRITRLMETESWAEEIIQEVFAKLWKVRHTLGGVENPQAYLYRMAGNRTLDFLKSRSAEVKLRYHVARMADGAQEDQTTQWFDFRRAQQLYQEAVERLPEKRRVVFQLKHEGGMSYEEIGSHLNLSTNTVRNQLARALDSIRRFLLEKGAGLVILLFMQNGQ